MNRKATPKPFEDVVLIQSGRRCCLCFGLLNDLSVKNGQIAHLDRNPSNCVPSNLVWLCLDHHAEYDRKSPQSKGITPGEVITYRARMHQLIEELRSNVRIINSGAILNSIWGNEVSDFVREALGSKVLDKMMQYETGGPSIGLCRLRIYRIGRKKPVVLVTQFPDNPGRSITNEAEGLAQQVFIHELNRPREGMVWIEHYTAPSGYPELESYMKVCFEQSGDLFSEPVWSELNIEEVLAITGCDTV